MTVRETVLEDLSQWPHVLRAVRFKGEVTDYGEKTDGDPATLETANVYTSEIADGSHAGQHTVAIDLDVPARLIPSSTPGHSHLYVDVPMTWDKYSALLAALADAGVIEPGYEASAKRRKWTSLRLPWIKKTEGEVAHAYR